jgi:hypothetical protein
MLPSAPATISARKLAGCESDSDAPVAGVALLVAAKCAWTASLNNAVAESNVFGTHVSIARMV